ncbi:hypothetical protein BGX26_002493, partial [Mortierella sp. AD094]
RNLEKNMVWNKIFSSPPKDLSLEDALELVDEVLENARKSKSKPTKALLHCSDAKSKIKDAEKIFATKKAGHSAQHHGIANAYREHAQLLEDLGHHVKAQKSHNHAKRWGYNHRATTHRTGPPQNPNATGSIRRSFSSPAALTTMPSIDGAMFQDVSESNNTQPTFRNLNRSATLDDIGIYNPDAGEDIEQTTENIFDQNLTPSIKYPLPGIGERFTSTLQLTYCLSLLNPSLMSKEGFDEIGIEWSQARVNDQDEQKRIQTVATDIIREFVRDELKKPDVIAEAVCLAAVVDQVDFRKLLQAFVNGIEQSTLLDVHLLDGLAQLIANASPGYIDSDDLVKILDLLNTRLKGTHQQSTGHMYRLALTVSHVLDSMVDCQVKGLKREQLHKPLLDYLKELQGSSDPSLVYQAAYAYQALYYIPDDESILQAVLRRTGKVAQGISGVVSAVKALDLNGFIEGLRNIQEGLEDAGSAIKLLGDAYHNAKTSVEGGKEFMECLAEGLSFSRESAWYPALRGLDAFLLEGRLDKFEELIREAPCQQDVAFQWGVCQRLGEIAANTLWGAGIRRCAISLLGKLYRHNARWVLQAYVKHWILYTISQLADSPDDKVAGHARTLLQELEPNSESRKQALSEVSPSVRQGPRQLMITSLPQASPLLDLVQNKPDVEGTIRLLKMRRLEERGRDVYISPRAKVNIRAKDDFDLTSHVQAFFASEKKVLLILGDSGAGKSTFNRALESILWDKYERGGRIPLSIHLPTIDKPEQDLINKHLYRLGFSEDQIRELKMYREFILICDGYDESQQHRNLYMSNQLNQTAGWRAQMLVSCRTEYTGADYKNCFQPMDRNNGGQPELFQEVVMTPFNADQIRDYIDQYVSANISPWKSEDYQQAFTKIRNLMALVKNPFLLKLALEVLPTMVDMQKDISSARVTRVELYDKFVAQWIERSEIRFREMNLNSRVQEAFRRLSDSGFKQRGISYLKDLTSAIYSNHGGNPVVSYSEYRDQTTWKEAFFNKMDEMNLIREAIPLMRNGDQYRLIHKSVLEYGLALAVFDPNVQEEYIEPTTSSSRRGSTSSALSFEMPSTTEKAVNLTDTSLLSSPLGTRNLVSEPSILQFLVERVQQHPVFKAQLHAVIQLSKNDQTARVAAANAITVLVRAEIQFNGADLRGIQIPGADLSYGVFDSALLSGADLRKTNLRNMWLRQTDLSGARMTGAQFGELPFLKEDCEAKYCAYSPDSTLFAVALSDGNVSLYEAKTWKKSQTLSGHSDAVNCIAFSKTGNQVVSASSDNTLKLWDSSTGTCIHTFEGHSDWVRSVVYSPNENQIVSCGDDKTVRVWDISARGCTQTFEGHTSFVLTVAYSPRGDQIASGSTDKTVRLWDVSTGDCIHILDGCNNSVWTVAYSPRGDQIASNHSDNTARLWDVTTGAPIHTLRGHRGEVRSLMYSPRGDQIASGSADKTIQLWDVSTGACIHTLRGHSDSVSRIVYSPTGDRIASCGSDTMVRLWDISTGIRAHHTFQGHSDSVWSVACSPKGDQIASSSDDKTFRLWDVSTSNCIQTLDGHGHSVWSVAYSPRGDLIASSSDDNTIQIWEVSTGNHIRTFRGHSNSVWSIAYSAGGDLIVSGSWDKTVRVWDVSTGFCIKTLHGHSDSIRGVAFSPTRNQVASASFDKTVRLWNVSNGACVHTLQGHRDWIRSVAYSPSGNQIASGSNDKTVRLWDVSSGKCLHSFEGHSNNIWIVAYSPRGDMVASGSSDRTVRLWDTRTYQCLLIIDGFGGCVLSLAFRETGHSLYLASGSRDKSVRWWRIDNNGDDYKALLVWSSSQTALAVCNASFNGVQGLSPTDCMLLEQRGAKKPLLSPL